MIIGSGIDMVEIRRIQHSVDRYGSRFLDRVYTKSEQAYCLRKRNAAESFAARFAAKEAGAKALGTGISYGVSWLEIEVVREPSGRPTLQFHGRAAEIAGRWGWSMPRFPLPIRPTLPRPAWCLENSNYGKLMRPWIAFFWYPQGVYCIHSARGASCQAAKRFSGRN